MSVSTDGGKVSIIITNHNAHRWLAECFASLRRQTYRNFEVIFVDNHSSDESIAFVQANYPETIIVRNERDEGFASGNNIGVRHARGEFVLLLNTDTKVTDTFLDDLLFSFREIPKLGCVQPKLFWLYDPQKLDSCGSYFTMTGFLQHVGNRQQAELPEYNAAFPVLSVKGACMMFRKSLLEKTGGLFDDDYYCYFEETDFCFRVWLAGYECWYYPKASIYHAMGGVTGLQMPNARIQYHSFKNRLTTYLKNLSPWTLVRMLPLHLALNIATSSALLVGAQPRNALAICKALFYALAHLPSTLKKRSFVQQHVRRVSDKAFLPAVTRRFGIAELIRQLYHHVMYGWLKPKASS